MNELNINNMIKTPMDGKICVTLKSTLDQYQPRGLLKLQFGKNYEINI